MLLFIRKVIEVFGGQYKEMRNAKPCSTNSDHYVLKSWTLIVSSTTRRKCSGGLIETARREDEQKFDIYYSHRVVTEDECLLGCFAAPLAKRFQKLRKIRTA